MTTFEEKCDQFLRRLYEIGVEHEGSKKTCEPGPIFRELNIENHLHPPIINKLIESNCIIGTEQWTDPPGVMLTAQGITRAHDIEPTSLMIPGRAMHALCDEISDASHILESWKKASDRTNTDPTGAITSARSMLESSCKYILSQTGETSESSTELPTLVRQVSQKLGIGPTSSSNDALKQSLKGLASIVQGLASIRNDLGDAHGKNPGSAVPSKHHAEFAVGLAGAASMFLIRTWKQQQKD